MVFEKDQSKTLVFGGSTCYKSCKLDLHHLVLPLVCFLWMDFEARVDVQLIGFKCFLVHASRG